MSDSLNTQEVQTVRQILLSRLEQLKSNKQEILKSNELRSLFEQLKPIEDKQHRAEMGRQINELRLELEQLVSGEVKTVENLLPIDVTAPFDVNQNSHSL
jgi:phenylalanyl-tRNA synthetase alpha subunit